MKPSEITIDHVREAMKRTADWARAAGRSYLRVYVEDLVWFVHGYVPPLPDDYRTRADRKKALLDADVFGKYNTGPTSSQIQACRKLLAQLVEAGEVERREQGNAHSYVYMSTEYMLHLQQHDELKGRANALIDRLKQALGDGALVDARIVDEKRLLVTMHVDEARADLILECLANGRA